MFKDVTLGRYIEKESPLHLMNPVLKLCALLLILVSLFLSKTLTSLSLPLVFFCFSLAISKIKLSYLFRGLGAYFFIITVFTFVRFALYHFTLSAAEQAVCIALRLVLIVLYSSLFSCTTIADDMARSIEILLRPLRVFGVNSRYVSLVFSVALRFIPVLSDQALKLHQAQLSRCGLTYARSKRRLKAFLSILVPLFAATYRRAVELALAMDSRCFSSTSSTHLYNLSFSSRDRWTVVVLVLYCGAFTLLRFI